MFTRDEDFVRMPTTFDWDVDLQSSDWDFRDATGFNDIEFTLAPSEDFWKRFEDLPDTGADLESLLDTDTGSVNLLRNHDCMWAGTCHNIEHKEKQKTETPKKRGVILQKTGGRSLLISRNRQTPPRPETPTSLSEDEDEKPVPAVEITGQTYRIPITDLHTNVKFDHNYDKQVKLEELGVQTPSDTEEDEENEEEEEEEEEEESSDEKQEESEDEEIDVVSLSSSSLPTNPSLHARFQLQQKMASAITTNTLLTAQRAVSRRLTKPKRKRINSDTEDEEEDRRKKWRSPKKSRFHDSEPMSSEKRSQHNNMERMRRIELRHAFEDLRGLVPSISTNSRAPKVSILRDASSHIYDLRLKDKTLQMQVAELRQDQERLRSTLSRLRRSLATTRN